MGLRDDPWRGEADPRRAPLVGLGADGPCGLGCGGTGPPLTKRTEALQAEKEGKRTLCVRPRWASKLPTLVGLDEDALDGLVS